MPKPVGADHCFGAKDASAAELKASGHKSLLYLAEDADYAAAAGDAFGAEAFRHIHVDGNYRDCSTVACSRLMTALDVLERPCAVVCRSGKRATIVSLLYDEAATNPAPSVEGFLAAVEHALGAEAPPEAIDWAAGTMLAYRVTRGLPGAPSPVLIRQLFDPESSTYTYIVADSAAHVAIIIDPVLEQADRDEKLLRELGLTPLFAVNSHVHADHVTGTAALKARFPGLKSVLGAGAKPAVADVYLDDGELLRFGSRSLEARPTPGHTAGCTSFVLDDRTMVFTGDTLFIRGCGRTDFQGGSATSLYRSVHDRLFSLPRHTIVYPGHNYRGLLSSTIGEELDFNPRLGGGKTADEFVAIMDSLGLPRPKHMDRVLPINMRCGVAGDIP